MSKYEEAVKTKQLCKKLINDFKNQNPTPKDRDKTGLRWRFSGIKKNENLFKEMLFNTNMYHGYYGGSSCTDDGSEEAGEIIAEILNLLKPEIVEAVVVTLERRIKRAAEEAAEEAKTILAEMEGRNEDVQD